MAILANTKHERFAQELAKGKTQVEAYVTAGYRANDSNAAQLAKRPEIQARVTELNGRGAERAEITLAGLLTEAADLQSQAAASKQFSAANQALKLKAELSGHYVQRKEDVTPRRDSRAIDARILELLGRRGEERTARTAGGAGADRAGDEAIPTVPGHGTA